MDPPTDETPLPPARSNLSSASSHRPNTQTKRNRQPQKIQRQQSIPDREFYGFAGEQTLKQPSEKLSFILLCVWGVNRRLQYYYFNELLSSFDVLWLTETKTNRRHRCTSDTWFYVFLINRCKLSKVRSGGIALLFRDALVRYVTGVNTDRKL